ncbi:MULTISPECIES: agmatine deiminase family protein [unclassified Microbulbifer]|uniref:agmatine deiminase family protein n=1 Tax=unclassified Microbulbifer TaxID=2619833 RepID=UPI0027E4108A|nr:MULTISPECIES: agmatine deiminase family protein [unclassified Microbulbifer]
MSPSFLPPEWAPQSAVMLTWPRADGDFARHFAAVERCFVEIAATISRYQNVHINYGLEPALLRDRLVLAGARPERLQVYQVESDDVWVRDHGPITVFRGGHPRHLDFVFNGWGGKFAAGRDNQVTRKLAEQGALAAEVETLDFVLEGGAIEVDGAGTLLTTERCLLAPTRNPHLNKAQIEDFLKPLFGVERVLWLRHGDLLGDDTDGHIDTIARFCDAETIAYQACENRDDAHFADLQVMAAELAAFRRADDQPYKLVPLPLPAPIYDEDGGRLPAGYANFLIINGAVLVPVYGDNNDEEALARLRPCFPGREVIGIDCRALIEQYGSLHCVTMQIPSGQIPQIPEVL